MLQPVTISPVRVRRAAPTLKPENGAWARPRASRGELDHRLGDARLAGACGFIAPLAASHQDRPSTSSSLAFTLSPISSTSGGRASGLRTPAAMLVMQESPSTRMPMWRAAITSGTVDMPTASAPSVRNARISAGVS